MLVEARLLPESQAESYRSMARFPSRLVHLYWDVADDRVYEYLRDHVGQLRTFAATVAGLAVANGGEEAPDPDTGRKGP